MEKKFIVLWVVIAVIAGALVWVGFKANKVVYVDQQGKVIERLGAVANIRDVGPEFGQNGFQTIVQSGSFKDATTTIVSIQNPFPATSTVSWIGLFNSGVATSTYNINCGQSLRASAPRVSSNPSSIFLSVANVATSSIFSQVILSASTSPTYIGPSEYLQCVAHGISSNDALGVSDAISIGWDNAFTNNGNTFDGTFWVEFKGLIK